MNLDTRTTAPYAALLLRVTLGLAFLAHGAVLKIGTFGLAGTMGFFGSLGYPPAFGALNTQPLPAWSSVAPIMMGRVSRLTSRTQTPAISARPAATSASATIAPNTGG